MSIHSALRIIAKYREQQSREVEKNITLQDVLDKAREEGNPCSKDELRKAFQIDWDLRWLKYSR